LGAHTHDGCSDPHDKHESTKDVHSGPEWGDKWRANIGNLCPVKCNRE
jgi:hypothetical protein